MWHDLLEHHVILILTYNRIYITLIDFTLHFHMINVQTTTSPDACDG